MTCPTCGTKQIYIDRVITCANKHLIELYPSRGGWSIRGAKVGRPRTEELEA